METMKAVRIYGYGGADVLRYEDAPRPVPGVDEVLLRVQAAAVNPVDWKVREGHLRGRVTHHLPLTLGWDVAGVVEAAGDAVTNVTVGTEVFGHPDVVQDGAYAEFIVMRAADVARRPQTLDAVSAAAVPLACLTAWQSLFDAGGLTAGQTVLIHGAAGGVGSFAVQLAHWKGACVIGTASAQNAELLYRLGADQVVDYHATRFEDVVHDVDVVLDTQGGAVQQRSWKVLKDTGVLVSIIAPPLEAEQIARRHARYAYVFTRSDAAQLGQIASLIDAGQLRPVVETVVPLAQARFAHELMQAGQQRGKIVLRVAAPL